MTAVELGPVRYEPPLTRSSAWMPDGWRSPTVLWTGPRWVRGASRWHRVRSGIQHNGPLHHVSLHMWCGQSLSAGDRATADGLPVDGMPLCGTCEGRAAGAGHTTPLDLPEDTALLFRPARLTPPRWCPGGAPYGPARSLAEAAGQRVVRCGACGDLVREKHYRWNDYGLQAAQHPPGTGLVPGCPQHAWRHLVRTVEGVACECAGLERAA